MWCVYPHSHPYLAPRLWAGPLLPHARDLAKPAVRWSSGEDINPDKVL
jgi:hypothetical protein